jgi:hypothetical protein
VTAPEPAETAVARLTAVLRDLLAHPQPGRAAWMQARDLAARELRDALNAALAERPSPLRLAGDGSQPSSRHPAAETAYRLVTVTEAAMARLAARSPASTAQPAASSSQPGSRGAAERLATVRARRDAFLHSEESDQTALAATVLVDDVPWLLAELDRLTAERDLQSRRADRMAGEARHWAARCAEVLGERDEARATLVDIADEEESHANRAEVALERVRGLPADASAVSGQSAEVTAWLAGAPERDRGPAGPDDPEEIRARLADGGKS